MIFTCGLIHIGQKKSLNDTVHHFLEFTKYYFEIFEFSKLICCPQDTAIYSTFIAQEHQEYLIGINT